ncbi:MAG: hypothetical protein IPH44_18300 [Myxococcales bacterium]|nr:hypothetical protein [Myxococcales bacterium]
MSNRNYKRSWKNLLINKQYQLRFTLIMVGLATLLMGLLGWWVIRVASEATTVSKSGLRGQACPPLPETVLAEQAAEKAAAKAAAPVVNGTGTGTGTGTGSGTGSGTDTGTGSGPGSGTGTGSGSGPGSGTDPGTGSGTDPGSGSAEPPPADGEPAPDEHRRRVVIESSSMTIEEPKEPPPAPAILPETYAQQVAAHYACEFAIASSLAKADHNFHRIIYVMAAAGLALILGLAVMGIKMTHKVAGPLYKVTLYLAKMRDGRYDKVYDLRKGDQLVAFYEHFKHAHAGAVRLEQADVARIKAALAAVEASGAAKRDPAVERAAGALAEALARKEKSLGG